MYLRSSASLPRPTCSIFRRSLFLFIGSLLLVGTITAQETRQTQENEAGRLMLEGMQLVADGSPASLTKAIEKFESARVLLHSLNNPLGEAAMLSISGSAYYMLEQNQKAIEKYEESLPLFRAVGEK